MPQKRIEYAFGPPRPSSGHSLGVSALVLSNELILTPHSYGTLFSGGRDGRINAWSLSPHKATHAARVSDTHSNWVFDLLAFSPQHVVSCSADTTVKLWSVEENVVTTIGHHNDYAECLAQLNPTSVVSGGLDRKIKGWDVRAGRAIFDIDTGHSIYAVAAVQESKLVAGGSPDGVVRVWDPRAAQPLVTKFTDHSDSVRQVYSQGDYIVSGSSEATVQVWSLRAGRLMKTYSDFTNSIWSLQPHHAGFIAGDRDGNIYQCDSIAEGHEPKLIVEHCLLEGGLKGICVDPVTSNLWTSTPFNPDLRCLRPEEGAHYKEVEVLKGHCGLRKHRLLNDKRRALIADTKGNVSMVDLISAKLIDFSRKVSPGLSSQSLDEALDDILEEVNTMDVLDNWCHVQTKAGLIFVSLDHRSINNTEVYLDDLVSHVEQVDKTPAPTPRESPFGTPSGSPANTPLASPSVSGFFHPNRSARISPAVSRVTSSQSLADVARLDYYRQKKLGSGQGKAKFYDPEEEDEDNDPATRLSAALSTHVTQMSGGASGTTPGSGNSSTGSTQNHRTRPNAQPQQPQQAKPKPKPNLNGNDDVEEPADNETADDEIRINLGNYVLENLLRGVVQRRKQDYEKNLHPPAGSMPRLASGAPALPPGHSNSPSSATANSAHRTVSGSSDTEGRPEKRRHRFLNKLLGRTKKREDEEPNSPTEPTATAGSKEPATHDSSGKPLTHMQIKQNIQQQQQQADSTSFEQAWRRAVSNHTMKSADPEAPMPDIMSRRARVVITELAPGAGAPTEIYSTTVGKLINNKNDEENIEKILPGWVGDALLLGKLNIKSPSRIGFSVSPAEAGDPDLSASSVRLMAISMLRARKIMAYTVGQLQRLNVLSVAASEYPPEKLVCLTCRGLEVNALTTLATIRTRIWRKGGDVAMMYSIKKKV